MYTFVTTIRLLSWKSQEYYHLSSSCELANCFRMDKVLPLVTLHSSRGFPFCACSVENMSICPNTRGSLNWAPYLRSPDDFIETQLLLIIKAAHEEENASLLLL